VGDSELTFIDTIAAMTTDHIIDKQPDIEIVTQINPTFFMVFVVFWHQLFLIFKGLLSLKSVWK
jgi:hypothetical protein